LKNALQLLNILKDQYETCRGYLALQNEKTECLVSGDIQKLDEVVLNEQSFIMKMESLDGKRDKILTEAGLADKTLSEIIENHADSIYVEVYCQTYADLSDILFKLKKANALNQRLIKERLNVLNRMTQPLS